MVTGNREEGTGITASPADELLARATARSSGTHPAIQPPVPGFPYPVPSQSPAQNLTSERDRDVLRSFAKRIDPSAELRDLHLRLLSAGDAERRATPSALGGIAPRQLPAALPGFVGRDAEMARMDMVVGPDRRHHIVILHGPGGSGKTALAVHWGHRLAASFPDGQLMVHLRGHGPVRPARSVARR